MAFPLTLAIFHETTTAAFASYFPERDASKFLKMINTQCDHFQQFYNRHNVKVHVCIIRWSHCVTLGGSFVTLKR